MSADLHAPCHTPKQEAAVSGPDVLGCSVLGTGGVCSDTRGVHAAQSRASVSRGRAQPRGVGGNVLVPGNQRGG